MKAIAFSQFGSPDVLKMLDLKMPRIGTDQILVQVHAASMNPIDHKLRTGKFGFLTRWFFPKVTGNDFSGTVSQIGPKVKDFKTGDRVFGVVAPFGRQGSCSEFVVVKSNQICLLPKNYDFSEAAAMPVAGCAALECLQDLKANQSVMIIGASGGVGTLAVQIAKSRKIKVAAVSSGSNVNLLRQLGADQVIDYTSEKLAEVNTKFDRIIDLSMKYRIGDVKHLLNRGGVFLASSPNGKVTVDKYKTLFSSRKSRVLFAKGGSQKLQQLVLLASQGVRPVISKEYSLPETPLAHQTIASNHTVGKIIIKVSI